MKIISLSPATTEILYSLDAGDLIVANTYFCDYPPEAKKKPKVGSFSSIDVGRIKKFKPDLILTSTVVQTRMYKELQDMGFNVVHFDPRSILEIIESIKKIGSLIGKEQLSEILTKKMLQKIEEYKKNAKKNKWRVYIEEWYDPPMYSGNWVPDIVELAGGEYFSVEKEGLSADTPEDKLLQFDPEYIFVSYCGFGTKSDPKKVLERKKWKNVSAVKNKKVFFLNETILNRPGPRILEAVTEIKKHLL
jgi:iron complex transport system substrate-binding protein